MLPFIERWILAVLTALDILVNALFFGRRYQTISSRIGESIKAGTWAARLPWPAFFLAHCIRADYKVEV